MKKFFAVIPVALALLVASCTVSEPADEGGATSSDARLESLSWYGQKLVKVSYDSQKRVSEIRLGSSDEYTLYRITYNPLVVESEEWEEYYGYDPSTDTYIDGMVVLRTKGRWDNISLNSRGAIVEMTVTDTDYTVSSASGGETEVETVRCSYDAEGHLTQVVGSDGEVTRLDWDGQGRLVKVDYSESDFDHNGSYVAQWEYSGVANTRLQWDPMLPVVGPVQITGLFGTAPSYFVKSVNTVYRSGWSELIQFAYRVSDNGFVNHSIYADNDEISMQYTWNYLN